VPSSPQYQEALQRAAAHFTAAGASQADAQRQAVGWVAQQVQAQSSLLSYIDVFWGFAVAVALLIPVALLLLRPVAQQAEAPAGH
jgi:DHA2 family multidrug resistance protein